MRPNLSISIELCEGELGIDIISVRTDLGGYIIIVHHLEVVWCTLFQHFRFVFRDLYLS